MKKAKSQDKIGPIGIDKTNLSQENTRARKEKPEFIIVHHTCTGTPSRTLAVLKKRGLSTHFEIDQAGKVFQYVDHLKRVAMHAGAQNEKSIGIDLTHLQGDEFTEAQMQSLAALVSALAEECGFLPIVAPDKKFDAPDPSRYGVYRHRNFSLTRCPDNANLEKYLTAGR